jgi:type IV pilus assembly protein PilE
MINLESTKSTKGFTIIELMVVVFVIAILAFIVMVNVVGYINKVRNAAVKANLASMVIRSTAYFDTNLNDFGSDFITSPSYAVPATAVQSADNGNIAPVAFGSTTTQAWCSCAPIYTTGVESGTLCVDSTGYKRVTTNPCSARCLGSSSDYSYFYCLD